MIPPGAQAPCPAGARDDEATRLRRFVASVPNRISIGAARGAAPLSALLGLLLYRHLVVPLNRLRDRADALRADELESTPLAAPLAARRDELGELAQALEHMAERLSLSLAQQRLLLRTLSHELRTPLARLRIAHDSELPPEQLRQRLDREIGDMQRLLEDTLDLAWMDTERPQLPTEPVLALSVWEALREDEVACRALGLNPTIVKLSAFTIGASFAGFAGSFFAARQGLVTPESFTFIESAMILAIVVLGGMGSQLGVILAAVVMVLLQEMRGFNEYRMLIFGLTMIVMMIWRPQGLLPMQSPHLELKP